ncbi:MAG TPA: hypothetical protein VMS17_20040 [Gemmataceae bacterium]|nr:hypothetical protein [Gemmataceae bacterium]
MQTVNFQCGNCNNLMAVGEDHLGQQVRCPHCQAVVLAPTAPAPAPGAPAPAAPSPAAFTMPSANEHEDIFAPPAPSDDLFGAPEAPRLQLPTPTPPPAAPPPQTQSPTVSLDGAANAAAPPAPESLGATMTYPGPLPAAPPSDATVPSWMDAPAAPAPAPGPPATTDAAALAPADSIEPVVRKPRDSGGWFIGLVFIPLVSYSLLATILVAYLFWRLSQQSAPPPAPLPPPNPLETLPSFDPKDENHSTHLKPPPPGQLNLAGDLNLAAATSPVPPHQIVQLGKKLRLGDLEVEPVSVDLERVSVVVPGPDRPYDPEPCPNRSLVLTLKMRNLSKNVIFQPLDAYFDRRCVEVNGGIAPPLTTLELTDKDARDADRFLFGGPAEYRKARDHDWVVRPSKDRDRGDKTMQVLQPDEAKEFFVCTDGGKQASDKNNEVVVLNYHGKLLWRVRARRGVEILDEHHYVPVSTVFGVEFSDADYRKNMQQ